jgi:hypothetical protein
MDQQHYVGLDVSLETTSVCVINQSGAIVWRGKCRTEPEAISQAVRAHAPAALRVGLETGQMSNWLTLQLRKHGLPVVCLDARHAKAALSLQLKSIANHIRGLLGSCGLPVELAAVHGLDRVGYLLSPNLVLPRLSLGRLAIAASPRQAHSRRPGSAAASGSAPSSRNPCRPSSAGRF